jgi:hypothetical protein
MKLPDEQKWLLLADAAARVGKDVRTLKRWHAQGELVAMNKVHGKWYVDKDELDRLMSGASTPSARAKDLLDFFDILRRNAAAGMQEPKDKL